MFQSTINNRLTYSPPNADENIINHPLYIQFFDSKVIEYEIEYFASRDPMSCAMDDFIWDLINRFQMECAQMYNDIPRHLAATKIQRVLRVTMANPQYLLCRRIQQSYWRALTNNN